MKAKRIQKRRQQNQQISMEFERMEPRTMLTAITSFSVATGVVTIDTNLTPVTIRQSQSGELLVNSQTVAFFGIKATTNNISKILVSSTSAFNDQVTLNLARPFAGPSGTIPFEINLGSEESDSLTLSGSRFADNFRVLASGIDLNGDSIVDLTNKGSKLERVTFFGRNGNDFLFFDKAGENFASEYTFDGQDGTDRMTFVGTPANESILFKFPDVGVIGLLGKISLISVEAPFTVLGNGGNDQLNVGEKSLTDAQQFTLDAGVFGGLSTAILHRTKSAITAEIRTRGIASLKVVGGFGNDILDFSAMTLDKLDQTGLTGDIWLSGVAGNNIVNGTQGPDLIDIVGNDVVNGFGGNDEIKLFVFGAQTSLPSTSVFGGSGTDKISYLLRDGTSTSSVTADFNSNLSLLELRYGDPNQAPIKTDLLSGIEIVSIESFLDASFGMNVDLSQLTGSEAQQLGITEIRVTGSDLNDTLIGSGFGDFIEGKGGNDILEGRGGNDEIIGGSGNDSIAGNNGNDAIFGGDGNDSINGGPGNDVLSGENGNDVIRGGDGDDTLLGDGGDDQLFGENGNDALDGGPGINFLDEGPGQGGIVINGTSGNDVILAGRQVINGVVQVVITVNGFSTIQPYVNGETIVVNAGAENDIVILEASAWNHWQAIFHGGDGNDSLHGGLKNDQLYGEGGNDWLFGLAGDDILVGGNGNDWLYGHAGRDLLIGGRGQDWLFGGQDEDVIIGGSTAYDVHEAALLALASEWSSGIPYANRAANLDSGTGVRLQKGTTVFDDVERDCLYGELGRDLFLADLADRTWDRRVDEFVN